MTQLGTWQHWRTDGLVPSLRLTEAVGLVVRSFGDRLVVNAVLVCRQGDQAQIERQQLGLTDWEAVAKWVAQDVPCHLVLARHAALLRKQIPSGQFDIARALPGADSRHFEQHVQAVSDSEDEAFFLRADAFRPVVEAAEQAGLRLATTSLGVGELAGLGVTQEVRDRLVAWLAQESDDGPEEVVLGEDQYALGALPGLGGAFALLGQDASAPDAPHEVRRVAARWLGQRVAAVGLALGCLGGVGGYVYTQQVQRSNAALQQASMHLRSNVQEAERVRTQTEEYQAFASAAGIDRPSYTALTGDRVLEVLPEGVQLTALTINPPQKSALEYSGQELQAFTRHHVQLSGRVNTPGDYSELLAQLEKIPFVASLEHDGLEQLGNGLTFSITARILLSELP